MAILFGTHSKVLFKVPSVYTEAEWVLVFLRLSVRQQLDRLLYIFPTQVSSRSCLSFRDIGSANVSAFMMK